MGELTRPTTASWNFANDFAARWPPRPVRLENPTGRDIEVATPGSNLRATASRLAAYYYSVGWAGVAILPILPLDGALRATHQTNSTPFTDITSSLNIAFALIDIRLIDNISPGAAMVE